MAYALFSTTIKAKDKFKTPNSMKLKIFKTKLEALAELKKRNLSTKDYRPLKVDIVRPKK